MTKLSPLYTHSHYGYPSLYESDKDSAWKAREAFFNQKKVKDFLANHQFDHKRALSHTLFVQPHQSGEIIVSFMDDLYRTPITMQIESNDPLYAYACMALTGQKDPAHPVVLDPPKETVAPSIQRELPSQLKSTNRPKESSKNHFSQSPQKESPPFQGELLQTMHKQQKEFFDFFSQEMENFRQSTHLTNQQRHKEMSKLISNLERMQTENQQMIYRLEQQQATLVDRMDARRSQDLTFLQEQHTDLQKQWISFLKRKDSSRFPIRRRARFHSQESSNSQSSLASPVSGNSAVSDSEIKILSSTKMAPPIPMPPN